MHDGPDHAQVLHQGRREHASAISSQTLALIEKACNEKVYDEMAAKYTAAIK